MIPPLPPHVWTSSVVWHHILLVIAALLAHIGAL